jgi:16S rRNA (cytidine1402-2'-O)-methyltransferase
MSTIYLVPSFLSEESKECMPEYILAAVKSCQVIFAENERTVRRYLKAMDSSIVIDDYEWFTIHKAEQEQINNFKKAIQANKNIAIISEAGCPGIADPGQELISVAQDLNCNIKPLVGPSSILLALMASGLNGQQFEFVGYLPIEQLERTKKITALELSSLKNNSTKIFIETPYRNNQLVESLLQHCNPNTKLCVAVNLTAKNESVITKSIANWRKQKPDLNKQPAIFLIYAS